MLNMNEMMNNQMLNQMNNIPFNHLNQIPINSIGSQFQELSNDIDFIILEKELEYNGSLNLNILNDQKKAINFINPTNTINITTHIPIFFTKKELYSYINKCLIRKQYYFMKIIL